MQQHPLMKQFMERSGGPRPDYRFSLRLPGSPRNGFTRILPFQKSWPAIIFVTAFVAIFSIPYFSIGLDLRGVDDLFDLVTNLFSLFWILGWSVGMFVLVTLWLALLFAREVLIVEPGRLRVRIEIFNIGVESISPLEYICHMRYIPIANSDGTKWRGRHIAFNFLDTSVSLGSELDEDTAAELMARINGTLQHPVPPRLDDAVKARLTEERMQMRKIARPEVAPAVAAPALAPDTGQSGQTMLVAANLVPLAGVFFFDWQVADIMLLFWFESAIVGFYNVLKMFRIAGPAAIFTSIFFLAHFGGFMSVHLLFIFGLFIEEAGRSASLAEVATIFKTLWPAILALFVSHGFSYRQNFLGRQEYRHLTIGEQMGKPYARIVVMHLTIIFGGFMVMALDSRLLALSLLVGLKIIVDVTAHNKSHAAIRKK